MDLCGKYTLRSFVFVLNPLQSLLFAAGLRPTPAQATVVSWVSYKWFDECQVLS